MTSIDDDDEAYRRAGAVILSRAAPREIRGAGYETAREKGLADLTGQYLGQQLTKEQIRRLRNTPLPEKPKSAVAQSNEAFMVANAAQMGKDVAKARAALPGASMAARTALEQLNKLMAHPGLSATVGLPNPFMGGLGFGTVPATPARDFANALEQSKSSAFLQAIAALRGTGAITEKEGATATAAVNNMDASTSEAEFKRAAQEYATVIQRGYDVARRQAQMRPTPFSYADLLAEKERRARLRGGK